MKRMIMWSVRILLLVSFLGISYKVLDLVYIRETLSSLTMNILVWMTILYSSAFILRAIAWRVYLKKAVSMKWCSAGIFYSFVLNHFLPIKAGDLIRAGILSIHEDLTYKKSFSSVIVLRSLDLFSLALIAFFGAFIFGYEVSPWFFGGALVTLSVALWSAWKYKDRFRWINDSYKHLVSLGAWKSIKILALTGLSWILEGIVIYQVAKTFGISLNYFESVWINSITIAGQVFHFTPGGIGTYESVMTAVLVFLGVSLKMGYSVALTTHLYKFALSFIIGIGLVIWTPIPVQSIKKMLDRKGELI